jgi:hypothetical protein
MRIDILTICTGKYTIFFDELYESSEKYFLPGHDKRYFVFTDGEIKTNEKVIRIEQPKLGWPFDTMMRFKMFNSIRERLDADYVFFLNANMLFVDTVGDEVIPKEENHHLMGVIHPGYQDKPNIMFPYERRPQSSVFIPNGQGVRYYQGCFNGGRTEEFMQMSSILEHSIDSDLSKSIVPLWHDESALNWYYSLKKPLTISPSYAYPESVDMKIDKKILQLDKSKLGGHDYLRV